MDPKLGSRERAVAIRTLGLSSFESESERLSRLLDHHEPQEVQLASLVALSRFGAPEVATEILRAWSSYSPAVRAQATEVLFARPERLMPMFDAIEGGRVRPSDLEPSRIKLLRSHPDAKVRERALDVLADVKLARRPEVVAAYRSALTRKGDVVRGKAAFVKACAPCHKVEGVGQEIGPNLVAMKNRGAEAILLNVLDPNREVNPEYLNYVVVTTDGRSLTGMITGETATSVTLRRREGQSDTVLRVDIATLQSTGLSLMPEDLEKEIDQQTMADLISYLLEAE